MQAETDDYDLWVPSFGVFFDALGQKGEGSITSGPVLGPPLDPFDTEQDEVVPGNGCLETTGGDPPVSSRSGTLCESNRANHTQLMGDREGSDTSVAPLVGLSLELMTPSLVDALLHARLFVRGEAAAAFGFERNLAGQEAPGRFDFPEGFFFATTPELRERQDMEELAIAGQGSRARFQVRQWVTWSVGSGVAFGFDLFGRQVRLKPSLEYLRYEMDLIGAVHRAVKLRRPSGTNDLSGFRFVRLTHQEKKAYDGLGPGLEVEVDASRLGPFISSIYIMGRGYHLFGDLESSFSERNRFGETATWTIEPASWVWRSGVGIRFRWVPERD